MALVCWKCGASLQGIPRPITRQSNCRECYAELHCCLACRHYTTRYTKQCDHDLADPPLRKETANFCDYFKPSANAFKASDAKAASEADAKLRQLFGEDKKTEAGEETGVETDDDADPKAKLEALFRKPERDRD